MDTVLEERHRQAACACRLLQRIPTEAQIHDWTPQDCNTRTQEIAKKIWELCSYEVLRAILQHFNEAGLCGVYIHKETKGPYTLLLPVGEDLALIFSGIRQAATSVAASGKQFHEHLESCVAKNITQEAASKVGELRQLKPRPLLRLLTTVTLDRARFIIIYLAQDQRRDLSRLLYRELGDKPLLLRMDKELSLPAQPTLKQRYAWVVSYLWQLKMHSAEMQEGLGFVPRVVAVADGDRMLVDSNTGQMADPLGAIHAPVWRVLSRELNKHGHTIKDPESERRIAKSVGVSRDKLRGLPALSPKITPDGKGGVTYECTGDDLLKSIQAMSRKKPRRKKQ